MTVRKGPRTPLGPAHAWGAIALAAAAIAGCGGDSSSTNAKHAPALPKCPALLTGAQAALGAHYIDLFTCTYTRGPARIEVTFDDGPQAWFRFTRAQVERTQTTVEWANTPNQQPKDVQHVGAGAFWIPATRELVSSDGRRLLTVRVVRPKRLNAAKTLAISVAPHGLGPNHVPVKTGP